MHRVLNKAVSIIILDLAILLMGEQYMAAEDALDPDEITKEMGNNISHEYAICAAYYFISSEALRRSGNLEIAAKYAKYYDTASVYALIAAKEGRTQELAEKVTLARLDLAMKSMTSEIDNDISNISILMNKYLYHCKEIMEDPDKIMKEWTEKILKKHNIK